MRVPDFDHAYLARTSTLIGAFRELFRSRALWTTSGIVAVFVFGGFWFYNKSGYLPLNTQPVPDVNSLSQPIKSPSQVANNNVDQQAVVTVPKSSEQTTTSSAADETPKPDSGQTSATSRPKANCDEAAKTRAVATRAAALTAEMNRFYAKGAVSSLTGGLVSLPTRAEIREHEAKISLIEGNYRAALQQAGCL